MSELVTKVLADQGYQGSDEAHPPELLLTFQWGSLRGDRGECLSFLGVDKLGLVDEEGVLSTMSGNQVLKSARSELVMKVMDLAEQDLHVVTICGFDHAAYVAGRAEMLWKTRIACSSVGLSMQAALPDMIAMAGPAIGRETTKVIVANPADKREGKVEYGELEVIDEKNATAKKPKK